MYEYYCDDCCGIVLHRRYLFWEDDLSTHIKFMPNGDFSITGGGNYIYDSKKDVKRNYTINGHIDQSTCEGTFTLKMTLDAEDLELRSKNNEEMELGPEARTFRYKESQTIEYSGKAFLYRFLQDLPNLSEDYLLITMDEYGDGNIYCTVKCSKAHYHYTYPVWANGGYETREEDFYDRLEIRGGSH